LAGQAELVPQRRRQPFQKSNWISVESKLFAQSNASHFN
jgi:hypothetical protein